MATAPASHAFRTEVRKMLHIITHSLYTNREIFLRELVSNASDALDKLRFIRSRGDAVVAPDLAPGIDISVDKEARILTIADTGVGMTRQELMDNLGTIARSGSEQFVADLAAAENAKDADAASIIGRFGVGFYAVFMVADRVEVTSRSYIEGEAAHTWTSDGLGEFTVEEATGDIPQRGTVIKAHLREDAAEFLEKYRIEGILRKHSQFISFPIRVDGEQVNTTPALWREPKFSITGEQYADFYKHLTFDTEAPLRTLHVSVDAPVQFTGLVFVPPHGQEVFSMGRDRWGLDLYVRRVLIQRENKDLLPEYLGFLKGIVDTEDLPLNISRETLQENVVVRKIGQTLTKQVLADLARLAADDAEAYATFWRQHGKVFKLGYSDYANREKFAPLLRFNSSHHDDAQGLTSLDDYISRAREGQKEIWYIAAPGREAARLDPRVEVFRRKGLEVLYLLEPIDEFVLETLDSYSDFSFKAVEHADGEKLAQFEDTGPARDVTPLTEDEDAAFARLIERMKALLGDAVEDVRISHRLADSPACLVQPGGASTSSMDRLLRVLHKDESVPRKVFEVNRDHPILRNLLKVFTSDASDPLVEDTTRQLFATSLMLDGYLKDPHELAAMMHRLMEKSGDWYKAVRGL